MEANWLCSIAYLIILIGFFLFGLRIIKKKEYKGKRQTGLFRFQKYKIIDQEAVLLGKSYMLGATLMALASILLIVFSYVFSAETASCFGAALWLAGFISILIGNILSHRPKNMIEEDDQ